MRYRIQEELTLAQQEAEKRNSSSQIFAAIDELQRLLKLYVLLLAWLCFYLHYGLDVNVCK